MTDPTPTPDPTPETPAADAPTKPANPKGYAVYDTRYLRFLPGVHDKKPTKAEAKKLAGHDDVEIREV